MRISWNMRGIILSFCVFVSATSVFAEADLFAEKAEGGSESANNATIAEEFFFHYEAKGEVSKEELEKSRDVMVGGDIPLTVQVRKAEEFPVLLHPGQRAAVFVELASGFKEQLIFTCSPQAHRLNVQGKNRLEVLFNKAVIFREELDHLGMPMCFVSASSVEPGSNILEIRNTGGNPLSFSSLELRKFSFSTPAVAGDSNLADTIPSRVRSIMELGISRGHEFNQRGRSANQFSLAMIVYFLGGGQPFGFDKFIHAPEFFDPLTGRPVETWFAALRLRGIFDEGAKRLPCNLVLSSGESYLGEYPEAHIAVSNTDGIVAFQCSALYGHGGQEAELLLPVGWEGETIVTRISGILPKDFADEYRNLSEIATDESRVNIVGGEYRTKLRLSPSLTLRLRRADIQEKESLTAVPALPAFRRPIFKKGLLRIANEEELEDNLRFPTGGSLNSLAQNYATSEIDATKGEIFKTKNVVPYDNRSRMMEISFPEGRRSAREGVDFFYSLPSDYDELSFWVYPRVFASAGKGKVKKATFQMYFNDIEGKKQFLAVDLEADKWQRVILPAKAMKLAANGTITIVGDPKLPEYKDGAKVSFELNGFCALGYEHPEILKNGTITEKGRTGLKTSRVVFDKKETRFVLTGEPGKYFEYRHRFAEPMELEAVSELSGVKTLKYVYKKEAQLLEVFGYFPLLKPFEVIDDYTPEEKMGFTPDPENPYSLSADARRNCIPAELAAYEKGESAILVVQSRFK